MLSKTPIIVMLIAPGASTLVLCRGHFPVSCRRVEIELKDMLPTGHFKPAAA